MLLVHGLIIFSAQPCILNSLSLSVCACVCVCYLLAQISAVPGLLVVHMFIFCVSCDSIKKNLEPSWALHPSLSLYLVLFLSISVCSKRLLTINKISNDRHFIDISLLPLQIKMNPVYLYTLGAKEKFKYIYLTIKNTKNLYIHSK